MPSVTFLVACEVPDVSPEALLLEADDILSACESAGLAVDSVVPWARPTQPLAQPSGGFQSLTQPPIQPTQ